MVRKRNNKGFSMIEMIVTIAILAVITGAAVSIFSWVRNNRIRSMAGNVNSAISDVRSMTVTKSGTFELIIKKGKNDGSETDKYFAIIIKENPSGTDTLISEKQIAKEGSISVSAGSNNYDVASGDELHISFNKSDGSFNKMEVKDSSGGSSSFKSINGVGTIKVSYASLERTITLNGLTGRHGIE